MLLLFAWWSDRIEKRWPFIVAGQVLCFIGFVINITSPSIGARYFGTFLVVTGAYSAFPGVIAWCVYAFYRCRKLPTLSSPRLGNNVVGQYKRGVGMAAQTGIGNIAASMYSSIMSDVDFS